MRNIQKDSCVEFMDISAFMKNYMKNFTREKNLRDYFDLRDPPPEFPDFLFFTSKDPSRCVKTYHCSSQVGRVGGAQAVILGSSCLTTGHRGQIIGRIQHQILGAIGSLQEMNRPDRDFHIRVDQNKYKNKGLSDRDFQLWNLGDGRHSEFELSKLSSNYDINSILHYRPQYGIKALNPYYNEVGFGDSYKMTATDKVALNIFLSCPTIKKQIFKEFEKEEFDRNYVELLQLSITPDEISQRSSLLYPPAFELKTSEADLSHLSGVFRKSERKNMNFRPVYINPTNSEYMFYQDSHWYIGFPEKRLRSKASDLTLVPLIDWEYLQYDGQDGQWRDLKEVNTDKNILHTFTLNLTIKHDFVGDNVQLTNTKKMIETQQMRTYDELRELDIKMTPESL